MRQNIEGGRLDNMVFGQGNRFLFHKADLAAALVLTATSAGTPPGQSEAFVYNGPELFFLNPTADRDVTLPAAAYCSGVRLMFFNTAAAASGFDLVIKTVAGDVGGAVTLVTVNETEGVVVASDGTRWFHMKWA